MSTLLDAPKPSVKDTVVTVCCSNCGSPAERHYLPAQHLIRTQCARCDYLMITCSCTHRVIEAYAPGLYAASDAATHRV